MIQQLLKGLINIIYGVERVKRNFYKANTNDIILASGPSKAIVTSHEESDPSLGWVTSQRAVVLLTDRRIKCGKWNIPLSQIVDAQLLKVDFLFGVKQILNIQTKHLSYRFEMPLNSEWTIQKVLPLTLKKIKVKKRIIENPTINTSHSPNSIYEPLFRVEEMS